MGNGCGGNGNCCGNNDVGDSNINRMAVAVIMTVAKVFIPALSTNKSSHFLHQCTTVSSTTVVAVAVVVARRPGGSGDGGGGGGGRQFIVESGRQRERRWLHDGM
jgi:hypothetical protein